MSIWDEVSRLWFRGPLNYQSEMSLADEVKLLQVNANCSRLVMNEAWAAARHQNCSLLILSEPNLQALENIDHHVDVTNGAAIVDLNGEFSAATVKMKIALWQALLTKPS